MKLISMTDFVLQHEQKGMQNTDRHLRFEKILKYAKFIKQPLKLEMFVPCDEEGSYWEFPPTKEEWEWAHKDSTEAEQSFKQKEYYYQKAKEKVLFQGFESVDTRRKDRYQVKLKNANVSGSSDTIQNDFAGLYFYNGFNEKSRVETIEDLLKFHPLKLSESAIKQIGL